MTHPLLFSEYYKEEGRLNGFCYVLHIFIKNMALRQDFLKVLLCIRPFRVKESGIAENVFQCNYTLTFFKKYCNAEGRWERFCNV